MDVHTNGDRRTCPVQQSLPPVVVLILRFRRVALRFSGQCCSKDWGKQLGHHHHHHHAGLSIVPRVTNGSNANSFRDNEIVYINGPGFVG